MFASPTLVSRKILKENISLLSQKCDRSYDRYVDINKLALFTTNCVVSLCSGRFLVKLTHAMGIRRKIIGKHCNIVNVNVLVLMLKIVVN